MMRGLLIGFGLGLGTMYMLDPLKGRRRRALVRDQVLRLGDALGDVGVQGERLGRGLRDRAQGLLYEARARRAGETVSDEVLVERVRARLGRAVGHPRAVKVTVHDGCVTLTGLVLAGELDNLIDAVSAVRGVQRVENQLNVHETPEGIPSLQGVPRESRIR